MAGFLLDERSLVFHELNGVCERDVVSFHEIGGEEDGRATASFGAMDEGGFAIVDVFCNEVDAFCDLI